jgi:hypothetical protein
MRRRLRNLWSGVSRRVFVYQFEGCVTGENFDFLCLQLCSCVFAAFLLPVRNYPKAFPSRTPLQMIENYIPFPVLRLLFANVLPYCLTFPTVLSATPG